MLGDAMLYGCGAGKLPTASAVVGDIVEAAKNLSRSMMSTWTTEKLELEEKAETKKKFFVRINGTPSTLQTRVEEVFGAVEVVALDDENNEFGFVTDVMSEGDYEKCAAAFPEICHMLRVE